VANKWLAEILLALLDPEWSLEFHLRDLEPRNNAWMLPLSDYAKRRQVSCRRYYSRASSNRAIFIPDRQSSPPGYEAPMTSVDQHPPSPIVPRIEKQDMPRVIAIGVAYFLAVRLSYLFPDSSHVMAVIWPASGISLAALLLSPKRKWPLLLAVIGAVDFLGKISLGRSIPVSAGYMLANVMESVLSAWFISRWFASPVRFSRAAELMALLGAAVLINGFTTLFGAGTAVFAFGTPFLSAYVDWWVGDVMGMLLITPLVVIGAVAGPELRRVVRWPRIAELVLFAALFCTMLWQVFGPSNDKAFSGLGPYILVLLFGWAALRFGRCITAIALLLLALVAVGFADKSVGSVILSGGDWKHHLMFIQIYVAVITLTALLFSINVLERTEAEQKVRGSEERHRRFVDSNIVGVVIATPSGGIINANDYYLRMIGYSREEFEQGMVDWRAITPPEWLPTDEYAIRELRDLGVCTPYEKEYVRQDGTRVPVFLSDAMLPGPEEQIAAFVLDITDRKRAEEALRASEERYRALFSRASDGIFIMSLDGKLIDINESFARMHGYSTAELLQMNIRDLDTTETSQMMSERMARLVAGETLFFEVEHYHKDGHVFPLEVSTGLVSFGGKTYIQSFHRDITARKKAEGKLIYIMKAVESASDAIGISDSLGHHIFQNKALTDLFGYATAEELEAAGGGKAVVIDPKVAKEMFDNIMSGKPWVGELEMVTKSGRVFPAFERADAIRNDEGNVIGLIGIVTDVTERKRAEEVKRNLERQVQQAQKLESLGVLAGGIAHDFNNLLMVVLGHAELALGAISPMSPARNSLTEITTAARRAADLSQQMLAYAGKAVFALERVELRELVEEMAHLLKTAISKKAILNLNLERGLPPIEADPSQIRQIVMNLIINASEAIGDRSGVITVSVGATRCDEEYLRKTELHDGLAPGLYVRLEVTDTGIGMDAETRSRIFEPFFSTKFTGRGLGLAAVLGIVRAHKGTLKVYSDPGKGTTFKILLPALEDTREGVRTNDSSPLADWRGKGTILLVDDEESLIALGARMLEHLGFSVLTAADGLQAVDLYRERGKEIDLVLMDLTMPHMDGAEAFGELHRLNPDARVILVSGYSPEDVASRFAENGLAGILQKPYTLVKLREALAGLMPKRLDGGG
jgi:two-component system, cell cycle sensor histidine kinase and response regulator CckA